MFGLKDPLIALCFVSTIVLLVFNVVYGLRMYNKDGSQDR
jgi:hypothetical protein